MKKKFFYSVIVLCGIIFFSSPSLYASSVEGNVTGIFVNPIPSTAVVSGVGTNYFTWGEGALGSPPSSLRFTGTTFSTDFEKVFSLGTLTFFNGTIWGGTGANTIDLVVTVAFTTPSSISKKFTQTLRLINTPNTDDPQESADIVFLPTSFPDTTFTVGGIEYTLSIIGFGTITGEGFSTIDKFHVLERGTASAELLARLTSTCVVPEGGLPKRELIFDFGTCGAGFTGIKNPTWGKFGKQPGGILEFDSGQKLKLECSLTQLHDVDVIAFQLFYAPPDGEWVRVGICPFEGGCNSGWFYHSGDNDKNTYPDCLVRTAWRSRDYGKNDKLPNPWTGEWDIFENNLDWAEMFYDVNRDNLIKTVRKFEYRIGPPVSMNLCTSKTGIAEGKIVKIKRVDPPLGSETEEFFDQVLERLGNLPPGEPMMEDTAKHCDFDRDGDCDEKDFQFFKQTLGSCEGDPNYHPLADDDGSGCIDSVDQHYLFPSLPGDLNGDGVIDSSDYQIFRSTLGKCSGDTGFISEADYDGDGCVTYADYRIWYGYYKSQ